MDYETEGREIEGVESENEEVEKNEGVENKVLPLEIKIFCLWNTPTINYNEGIANQSFMVYSNLIVGSHALHSVAKAYVNVVNAISTFVESTPPTNIITNGTILTQYSIKQGIKVFGIKAMLQ